MAVILGLREARPHPRAFMPKVIAAQSITGQEAVAIAEREFLRMGFVFYPTGQVEAGVDGFVELRDGRTGAVGNQIVQVQIKGTKVRLPGETDKGFHFLVSPADLAYWSRGTAELLLVVVKPDEGKAWWRPIRDALTGERGPDRRIEFDKERDLLGPEAAPAIRQLAAQARPGAVLPSSRLRESLTPNLLRVHVEAANIYIAETRLPDNRSMWAALKAQSHHAPGEFLVKGGRVITFHNLDDRLWRTVCDQGTVEALPTSQWSETDDADARRDFARLLMDALRGLTRDQLHSNRKTNDFWFRPPRGGKELKIAGSGKAKKTVVSRYEKKANPQETSYFRHHAFRARFERIGLRWFLVVEPSYRFTRDGLKESAFADDLLSGIKRIEKNGAVLSNFAMWARVLSQASGETLLSKANPFIRLEAVPPLFLDVGVPEALWLPDEDPEEAKLLALMEGLS